ncbi:MAG: bifunctional 3,4-dihydroxy-2-butanone-4-phosphate synthase/GTP cyclohydrolase II [Planctomycetes bacterium]|nr:bifunctional 3,4-dihydroxy-2-butanone-4-phosphate synthase/GTP cyclohydrolase II [Planctomycetota bacterium]
MSSSSAPGLSTIPELIDELREGRMIILVDDEDRENEGDLVFPAAAVTPEKINFLLKEARGELCLSLSAEICEQLGLELQAKEAGNRTGSMCAFTVTIEAATGVTTGTSAYDRSRTIEVASREDATPADITKPGHVHPLRARRGGSLVRPGHTEGSVDLCRLAGHREAAVIMEILDEDGTMARLPSLRGFAEKHGLKIGTIADLIAYRRRTERLVTRGPTIGLPTPFGSYQLTVYTSPHDDREHIALTRGLEIPDSDDPAPAIPDAVIGRVHSECLTGDVFHSERCDCGPQLDTALRMVGHEPRGFVLYMRQEGRGIGLINKLRAYALQDGGLDTVEANQALGFQSDQRNYGTGASILFDLGIRSIRLLTNNPTKRNALTGYGLQIVERIPLVIDPNEHNRRYLETKRNKMGHML